MVESERFYHLFFVRFWVILGTGVTGGVTKWGYIFEKVGLQNSCQAPPCRAVASEQKRGGKCKKLTLCEQL